MTEIETKKFDAQIAKLMSENAKLVAETARINQMGFWYPMILAAAMFASIGALVKYVF